MSNLREAAGRANVAYAAKGKGVEAMFVEKMVRELKSGGRAFIIIPDGLLLRTQTGDRRFRAWISEQCHVDGIVSLPVKTFFATPKKTYVLALTKKQATGVQRHPVFAYLATSIGETLDAGRYPTNDSDMPEMARRFRQAVAGRAYYEDNPLTTVEELSPKAKHIPAETLIGNPTWEIDRFWSKAEKIALGLQEEPSEMSAEEFFDELNSIKESIEKLIFENRP